MTTTIEWTDETWNPIVGCSRVSPGCDHCYAVGVVHRQMSPQHVGLTVKSEWEPTDWTGEVRVVEHKLDEPLRWRKPRRVFVNSLSDLFHPDVSDDTIARIFAVMALAPQHTFQVLTKRPQRMADMLATRLFWKVVASHCADDRLASLSWPQRTSMAGQRGLPNVWLGTSIELDKYSFRADHLRRTPAAVRFISAEPLLGPLPSLDLTGIDWLIVGGESGPGARPMHPDWVRDLRDRCFQPVTCDDEFWPLGRTSFFFKQWGAWSPPHPDQGHHIFDHVTTDDACQVVHHDGRLLGRPWGGWKLSQPGGCVMRRYPKHDAGRVLDGRTWDEMPA